MTEQLTVPSYRVALLFWIRKQHIPARKSNLNFEGVWMSYLKGFRGVKWGVSKILMRLIHPFTLFPLVIIIHKMQPRMRRDGEKQNFGFFLFGLDGRTNVHALVMKLLRHCLEKNTYLNLFRSVSIYPVGVDACDGNTWYRWYYGNSCKSGTFPSNWIHHIGSEK